MEKRPWQFPFLIQSPERNRTRSGRSAASPWRTAEVLRPIKEGGSMLDIATVWANWRPGNNASVQPLAARSQWWCFSPARGSWRQLRDDWRLFKVLVDLMERRGLGITIQPTPLQLGRSFWRCSLVPSCSDFLHQGALRGCKDVLLLPFLPGPSFCSCWTKIAHLEMPAAEILATHLSRRHKLTVGVAELWGWADRVFEVLRLPWMQSSKLRLICEATRYLAYTLMKYADYLDPSTEIMPGIIYTTEYWIVNNTECDPALWMNRVWWLSFTMGYSYTFSVCKEGIHRSINGTGIIGMGWKQAIQQEDVGRTRLILTEACSAEVRVQPTAILYWTNRAELTNDPSFRVNQKWMTVKPRDSVRKRWNTTVRFATSYDSLCDW